MHSGLLDTTAREKNHFSGVYIAALPSAQPTLAIQTPTAAAAAPASPACARSCLYTWLLTAKGTI